jgi:hypothetical protein
MSIRKKFDGLQTAYVALSSKIHQQLMDPAVKPRGFVPGEKCASLAKLGGVADKKVGKSLTCPLKQD